MGLKEAKDGFLKAHGELVRAMGKEVDRIEQEVTAVDEELVQLCKLLECTNKEHAEYELEMFKQVRAASKAHDEKVLQVSQQIELKRKRKEQLSKSLHSLLQSSLANLALPDTKPSAEAGIQLAQHQAQPDPAVIDSDPAAAAGHQQETPADREVMVKVEPIVEPPAVETQAVKAPVGRGRPKGRKPGRKKKGAVLANTPRPDPDSPEVKKKRRTVTELMVSSEGAGKTPSTRGAPGTGRYFLRTRPSASPTTGSVMIVLT